MGHIWKKEVARNLAACAFQQIGIYIAMLMVGVVGWAVTRWISLDEGQPPMTRFDWAVLIIGSAIALALLVGLVASAVEKIIVLFRYGDNARNVGRLTNTTKKLEYVQFRFPYTWKEGPGFKLQTLPADGDTEVRERVEEIHVFVHVINRMQNVEFEMKASRLWRNAWETVATVGSERLVGVVHKDVRQSFVVMRRTFTYVPVQYINPFTGACEERKVRAEKNIIIFPEAPTKFDAKLGDEYLFSITIRHDEGPERASFKINLHPNLSVPQTRLFDCENIEPMLTRK